MTPASQNPATKPLWQRFLVFLLPLMLSNILQSLSGTINNIYVAQLIGTEAMAAASIFFPILFFLMSFIIGLSAGATVLIGQAWGARNIDKVKQVVGTTMSVTFLAGLVISVFGGIFAGPIMQILGAPENILDQATAYGRTFLIGMPLFFIFLIATSVLRGVGDTITPLVSLGVSIVVGLLVTPAFILGWLGLPKIGVAAAAVGALASFLSVLIFLFFYLRWRKHPVAPDRVLLENLRIRPDVLMMVLRLGVPAGVQMIVASVAAIVVVGLVNHFGSDATAAYGAVNQVQSYVQFPALSIAIGASIFAAQAIGAGQSHQLGAVTRTALIMNLLLTGTLVLIAYIFAESVVRLFIKEPEIVAMTQELLHIVLWASIMFGAASILAGVMRASGVVLVPMIFSIVAIVLVELPVAVLLSRTSLGLHGIWWGYVASFGAMLVMNAAYYWFVWRKKTIRALV